MGKLLLLTLDEQEEKVIDKIISALSSYIQLEDMQVIPVSVLSFQGLEIRQSQHRVFPCLHKKHPGNALKTPCTPALIVHITLNYCE